MIDLTHPVNENTIAWPSVTPFTAKQVHIRMDPDPLLINVMEPGSNKYFYKKQEL